MAPPPPRRARAADAAVLARLLHDFDTVYSEPTLPPDVLAERIRQLLAAGQTLGGADPCGLAVLRFRPSYGPAASSATCRAVRGARPPRPGLGPALMTAAMDLARPAGADYMDLGTSEDDVAARGLYESPGFSNLEGKPDGPISYYYE